MTTLRLEEIHLEDLLRAAWLHRKLVVILTIGFGLSMWLQMVNQPNVYQAAARILIETESPQFLKFQEVSRPGRDRAFLQTEYEVIASRAVMGRVLEQLHLAGFPPFSRSKDPVRLLRDMVKVVPVRGTKLVDIAVTGRKPELAARIANTVADTYAQLNLERQRELTAGGVEWLKDEVDKMEKKMREAQLALQEFREQHGTIDFGEGHSSAVLQRLQSLNASLSKTREERIEAETKYREKHPSLQELLAKERELQLALFDQEQHALEMSRLSIQYNALLRDAKTSESIYNVLLTRLKELSVQEGLQSNNVQVVDYALVPDAPIGPPRRQRIFTFTLLGLAVGCGLSFLLEFFSKSVRTRQEFEQALSVPFLGHVPFISKQTRKETGGLIVARDPKSNLADTIRSVRTTLDFILPGGPCHVLLITSALPEEGKSLVCSNLAVAFHELGRRVLLVDADLRRPSLHRAFQVNLEPGLSTYLEGSADKMDLIQTSPLVEGLSIIPAGMTPSQPTELLGNERMRELLEGYKAEFQHILLDSPPVLVAADSAVLSGFAEGTLLVVRAGQTQAEAAAAGKQRLVDVGAKLIGGVLNCARLELERGYRYYYSYRYYRKGYGHRPERRHRPAKGTEGAHEGQPSSGPAEEGPSL